MARGTYSPSPALPKASFTKIEDDVSNQPPGVHDQQARTFGYNDFSTFHRPDTYIRYVEPPESEVMKQVEYDMDEQDQEWLDAVNNERRAEQLDKVTYETFEIIMDKLEKEWFELTKNIVKPDLALPSEDSTCAICDDSEGENSNAIVFCDGCNLAVHQDCYGVPYIPEGQWLCRKCTVSPDQPVSCILCPNEGGAFKQTTTGKWAHLLCAIWVPETRVANDVFMEPITGVERINKQRWKLKCSLCGIREGACVQCSKTSCFLAFHATCARRYKLLMPMKSAHGTEPATLTCYCEKHLPSEHLDAHQAALADLENEPDSNQDANVHTPRTSKKARAYAKSYKLAPPLVPAIIVRNIADYITPRGVRKKFEFVQLVCRYWSLKREARRGAPLLKRLHLSPWALSANSKPLADSEKLIRLKNLRNLREDLERVRMLVDLTKKREDQKLQQALTMNNLLTSCMYPHGLSLQSTFDNIVAQDRHGYFKAPVQKEDAPDYRDIIQQPMCWNIIEGKLDKYEYWDLQPFRDDILLVFDNAMTYNKSHTPIYRAAHRLKASATQILDELAAELVNRPATVADDVVDVDADAEGEADTEAPALADNTKENSDPEPAPTTQHLNTPAMADNPDAVGDLEPPLSILSLLTSKESIQDDLPIILTSDPLTSLFNFELEKLKPRPPPPPPKPRRERERKAPRHSGGAEASSSGLRADLAAAGAGPRTRRARAAEEAFEAEAGISSIDAIDAGESSEGAAAATVEEADAAPKKPRKSRSTPFVLPGKSEVPPMVEDVDSHKMFTMFDAGWILPDSQRRGGRAPIERHEGPPPRKRQRTVSSSERQKSTLSVYSTPASENQTLPENAQRDRERETTADGSFILHSEEPSMELAAEPSLSHSHSLSAGRQQRSSSPEPPPPSDPEPSVEPQPRPLVDLPEAGAAETEAHQPGRSVPTKEEPRTSSPVPPSEHEVTMTDREETEELEDPSRMPEPVDEGLPALSPSASGNAVVHAEPSTRASASAPAPAPAPELEEEKLEGKSHVQSDEPDEEKPSTNASEPAPEPELQPEEEDDDPEPDVRPATIIIETLDTPAIRREKARARKALRERQRLEELERQRAEERWETERLRKERLAAGAGDADAEDAWEMSSLSSLEDSHSEKEGESGKVYDDGQGKEGGQEGAGEGSTEKDSANAGDEKRKKGRGKGKGKGKLKEKETVPPPAPGEIVLKEGEMLESGTLVWAKADSYPWWAAVIFDSDLPEVPDVVLRDQAKARAKGTGPLHLVRFFDAKRSWQWLHLDRMKMLGENKALDDAILQGTAKGQRFKTAKMRSECRKAYSTAMSEMETDGDADGKPEQGKVGDGAGQSAVQDGASLVDVAPETSQAPSSSKPVADAVMDISMSSDFTPPSSQGSGQGSTEATAAGVRPQSEPPQHQVSPVSHTYRMDVDKIELGDDENL